MDKRVIAFLVYPEMTPLDLIGPLQVIKVLEGLGAFKVVTVGERALPMETDLGLRIQPEKSFHEVSRPFCLIVPGGVLGPIKAMINDPLMQYVRESADTAEVVGSVCTGSLILAAAGLLDGVRATTHWMFLDHLQRLGAVSVRERWVEDGKFITAAGVAAGIDMALALAARLTNEATARMIQTLIEYDPKPPFGGIDWDKVNPADYAPALATAGVQEIPTILASKPELLAKFSP